MEFQQLLNIVVITAVSVISWFARELWAAVQKLKEDLVKIEVDLPTNYVRKIEMSERFDKLEAILERIFEKIEKKADKQ